jgi:hypothetical protein
MNVKEKQYIIKLKREVITRLEKENSRLKGSGAAWENRKTQLNLDAISRIEKEIEQLEV